MALLNSAVKLTNGTPLPADRFEKFARPVMNGRRWAWVDPQKDQEANATALAQRTTSRIDIVAQQGGDIDTTFRNIARVKKLAAKYEISLPEDVEASTAVTSATPSAAGPEPTKTKNV